MLPNPFIQSCARCACRHCARKSFISWSLWAAALSSLFCRDYQILCFKEFDYQNALIVQKRILKVFRSRIFRKKNGISLEGRGLFENNANMYFWAILNLNFQNKFRIFILEGLHFEKSAKTYSWAILKPNFQKNSRFSL